MFKYFNKLSLFLPMVKAVNVNVSNPYFKKSRFLSTTLRTNVISSSQCLQSLLFNFPISKEQQATFSKDFEESDTDKDGRLSQEEFKKAIKKSVDWITDNHAQIIWEQYKGTAFGFDPELVQPMTKKDYLDKVREVLGYKKFVDESISLLFLKHDADHDGKLTPQEATGLITELVKVHKKGSIEKDIKTLAKDGDGKITLGELKKYFWFGKGRDPFAMQQ